MTTRLRDWQNRLQALLTERSKKPFAWGTQDCALFAADCVEACTGVDPARDLRGTYRDALGAARIIEQYGGLGAIAAARLGPEVLPPLAQPGDIGLVVSDGRECLAVCGGTTWHVPGTARIEALLTQATRVWRLCA